MRFSNLNFTHWEETDRGGTHRRLADTERLGKVNESGKIIHVGLKGHSSLCVNIGQWGGSLQK